MTVWPLQSQCPAFYGNPTVVAHGVPGPDPKWEMASLTVVRLPWAARADWDPHLKISALRVHKRCADSLGRILLALWQHCDMHQVRIEEAGLADIGGGYAWRRMRGGQALSMHSFGCAVDFDSDRNAFGDPAPRFSLPPYRFVIDAFEAEGWVWGGRWSRPDGMHFQAARVE